MNPVQSVNHLEYVNRRDKPHFYFDKDGWNVENHYDLLTSKTFKGLLEKLPNLRRNSK